MQAFEGGHDQLLDRIVGVIEDDTPDQIIVLAMVGDKLVSAVSTPPENNQFWAETLRDLANQFEAGTVTMAKT